MEVVSTALLSAQPFCMEQESFYGHKTCIANNGNRNLNDWIEVAKYLMRVRGVDHLPAKRDFFKLRAYPALL